MRIVTVAAALLLLLPSASSLALRRKKYNFEAEGYSDDVSRSKIYPMSAAAYSDEPQKCVDKVFGKNAEIAGQTEVKCDFPGDRCFAFIVVSHSDEAIIISFRGTEGSAEMQSIANDINFIHEKFEGGGKVGKWFLNAFQHLWKGGLKDHFLAARNKNPEYQVWITGHNTGGSIASIAAASMIYEKVVSNDKLLLVTMGQLRTGNRDYADAHDRLVKNSYRVVHNRDGAAHLPAENFEGYYHHGREIWYENSMGPLDAFHECKEGESSKCSDGLLFTLNFIDSYVYYDIWKSTVTWGKDGCEL